MLGVLILPGLLACTQRQVYTAIQQNQQLECQKLPQQSAYEECMKQVSEPYDDYQRDRAGLGKGAPQ
jgi:hypothetical protein